MNVASIREFDPARDTPALKSLVIELQNHERQYEPGMPEGSEMAQKYIDLVLARCHTWDGRVFVADAGGEVVGFSCVWARMKSDDDPSEHAFVSDLAVSESHRGRGIGRALLSAAEAYARTRGARVMRIRVLAQNAVARGLYEAAGFLPHEIQLVKHLT